MVEKVKYCQQISLFCLGSDMFLNLGLGGRFLGNEWRPCLYCWIWSIRFVLITYSNLTGGKYHCVYFNKYLELRRLTFMDLPKLLAFLLNSVENRALIWCLKKKKNITWGKLRYIEVFIWLLIQKSLEWVIIFVRLKII